MATGPALVFIYWHRQIPENLTGWHGIPGHSRNIMDRKWGGSSYFPRFVQTPYGNQQKCPEN
jgi:hypothetical protein